MALSDKATKSFDNLTRSFAGLSDAVKAPITEERDVAGIIKCFELTYETAWRTLQKIAADQGAHAPGRTPMRVAHDADAQAYDHALNSSRSVH